MITTLGFSVNRHKSRTANTKRGMCYWFSVQSRRCYWTMEENGTVMYLPYSRTYNGGWDSDGSAKYHGFITPPDFKTSYLVWYRIVDTIAYIALGDQKMDGRQDFLNRYCNAREGVEYGDVKWIDTFSGN
ncbi:hypothetical protein PILCRDRAFT_91802 [Piloderma croceum F 1598]|uniref:Uncharacterized protein n=1 Tax=Piloderma croceum (strain F 1598) TaxID=765440 RepID=A0A0C3F840_PILCF|nr:hypothetical protein PILCRDRAFT_91802 [Piloderma croceum F 1598]